MSFVSRKRRWKGTNRSVGLGAVERAGELDRPVVAAYLLVVTFMFILINLVVDLLYTVLDPRVRLANR